MQKKTTAPNPTVWERIKVNQLEMNKLFKEAVEDIFKNTEGLAFLGEDNTAFVSYWLKAVQANPEVMDGLFDTEDFAVKENLFSNLVTAYNDCNAGRAILDTPYDILSQDVFRYAMDAKIKFDAVAVKNQKYKQVVKDAPQYRKPSKPKATTDKTTDASKSKTVAETVAESTKVN